MNLYFSLLQIIFLKGINWNHKVFIILSFFFNYLVLKQLKNKDELQKVKTTKNKQRRNCFISSCHSLYSRHHVFSKGNDSQFSFVMFASYHSQHLLIGITGERGQKICKEHTSEVESHVLFAGVSCVLSSKS